MVTCLTGSVIAIEPAVVHVELLGGARGFAGRGDIVGNMPIKWPELDYLHQPFRKKLVPFLDRVITAAERAGALGAFLSGSGSAICALALDDSKKIAAAMLKASRLFHTQTVITRADNRGVCIFKSAIE